MKTGWRCTQDAECLHPESDGNGGRIEVDFILGRSEAESFKGDLPPHGLCGWCWFAANRPPIIAKSQAETPSAEPIAGLDPTRRAWETRQEFLRNKLHHVPSVGPQLVRDGLWTGTYDEKGLPIPSADALESGLWQRTIFPVYNSPDPATNKRRSLRDTLITNPECGPRLVSAGLWSGMVDSAGFPIP